PFGRQVWLNSFGSDVGTQTLDFGGTYTLLIEGYITDTTPVTYGFNVQKVTNTTLALKRSVEVFAENFDSSDISDWTVRANTAGAGVEAIVDGTHNGTSALGSYYDAPPANGSNLFAESSRVFTSTNATNVHVTLEASSVPSDNTTIISYYVKLD